MTNHLECILCRGHQFKSVYLHDAFVVLKCNECGLVFQSTRSVNINTLDDYYTHRPTEECLDWKGDNRRIGDIADTLADRYPQGKLLDVGCGSGKFIYEMSNRGIECTGVEPNIAQATYAKNLGFRVRTEIFKDGLFESEYFDVITFLQVMEHLPNPIQALRTAYLYLRPGGMVVADVPSYNNPRILVFRVLGIKRIVKGDFIKPHLFYFTPATLSTIVKQSGFLIDRIDVGRYNEKFGPNLILKKIDVLAKIFGIGGIVIYGGKSATS